MPTLRSRSLVSLAAALTVTLTLAGCASAPSRLAWDAPADAPPLAVRFDNDARDYVHVYLIGEQRQWLLGRVEPGARATLRIPEAVLAGNPGSLRLAVLAGQRVTLNAAGEAGAAIAIEQPAAAFLSQRWSFSQTLATGQLTALPRARAEAGHR